MDKTLIDHSYEDKAYPIKSNQTISQPFTVAIQTQLLNIKKNEKILEIGTGSGYQTAILSILSNNIYTIERNHDLYKNILQSPRTYKIYKGFIKIKITFSLNRRTSVAFLLQIQHIPRKSYGYF